LAALGVAQGFGHCRSSRFVFIGVERVVARDFDQRVQSNQLPLGPSGIWWTGALRVALEPLVWRWQRRSLLSGRPRLYRLCFHGGLLWSSTKQCPWRHAVAGIGNRRRIYFGILTANARRALHEPHPLDGMVVLDCRLDEPCSFSPHWTKSKKLVLIRLLKF